MRGYLPSIRKGSVTDVRGFVVYVKEDFPFPQDLSLKKLDDSYLCFQQALLHSVSYFHFP